LVFTHLETKGQRAETWLTPSTPHCSTSASQGSGARPFLSPYTPLSWGCQGFSAFGHSQNLGPTETPLQSLPGLPSSSAAWMLVVPTLLPVARGLRHSWHSWCSPVSHASHSALWEMCGCESAHWRMKQTISWQLAWGQLVTAAQTSRWRDMGQTPRLPGAPPSISGNRLEKHLGEL